MKNNADASDPGHEEGVRGSVSEYLKRAMAAVAEGDAVLGMHLYLAAFEEGASECEARPCEEALNGLKKAWTLACTLKERSLAEYIFEKMEPYLSSDEISLYAGELQDLALDKLEEFGLNRDDLEDMAEMITQDFFEGSSSLVKVEHIIEHPLSEPISSTEDGEAAKTSDKGIMGELAEDAADGKADVSDEESAARSSLPEEPSAEDSSEGAAKAFPDCAYHKGAEEVSDADGSEQTSAGISEPGKPASNAPCKKVPMTQPTNPVELFAQAINESDASSEEVIEQLDYDSIAGYSSVIDAMRDLGIGMHDDVQFREFVKLLNTRHGLDRMPALDTLLFRAPVHEDANRFVLATLGELDLPVLRMSMEESLQGMPVLCVAAQAENAPKLNSMRNAFEGGGVLVLEDIDMWGCPFSEAVSEDMGNFLMMHLSRGAREAVNLIRSAVENPDVYVFATASSSMEIDPFFLDLLDPLSFVDIDYPTSEERAEIWMEIAHEHPSIRNVNQDELVRLSANMPRFDIYMAAREALEEAYKLGLTTRRYQPVTRENLFDKLAAYQPLESREYCELESAILQDFRSDLDHIDDLLDDD